jgi:hypothetical protein
MTNCTGKSFSFTPLGRKKILANFSGGDITSNAGVFLLREIDRRLKVTEQLANLLPDKRQKSKVEHSLLSMLRQRIYAIACGDEDVNDHDYLRHDLAFQAAIERDGELASAPTLSRMENSFNREACVAASSLMIELFIQKHQHKPLKELILDFDATDDPIHGNQEGKHFNGYYDCHCYMPLYVFCGDDLLVSYLRESNIDGAKHAWAILALLVKRFRQEWPNCNIIFRGDGGFCRDKMLLWCERNGLEFITGMAKNNRLMKVVKTDIEQAKEAFEHTGEAQRCFVQFEYAANSWKIKRTMVARIEYNHHGESVRFVTTNINGYSKRLYEKLYCQRGDMENKIKQQKLDLFADRTSCHWFISNQMRLLLSSFAYILIQALQDITLKGTKLAKAYASTIRNQLLKIGAVITKNTRTIKLMMSSAYTRQALFESIAHKLVPT